MDKNEEYFKDNQKMWNDRVDVHTHSEMYDIESFKAGINSLTAIDLDDIGDVRGKKILTFNVILVRIAYHWHEWEPR